MHSLIRQIRQSIAADSLLRRDGKVIVACSGGADSVALLASLVELGYDCVAAHCNYHLRGAESMRDADHVLDTAARLDVDVYLKDFDVDARRRATGESIEMACRALRYDWFRSLLDRDCAQAVAVGHHREDQIETFFLNLMRGTGIAGLTGMSSRNGDIVRPMLGCSRADIEDYLRYRGLTWVDDSTNAGDDFARNRIRNRLMPLMAELFERPDEAILRTMSMLRDNRAVYDRAIASARSTYTDIATGDIDLTALSAAEPQARVLLFEMLRGEGFNRTQTDGMLAAAARDGGRFTAPGTGHAREVDHGMLRAPHATEPLPAGAVEIVPGRDIHSPVHIAVTHHHITEFKPERNPKVIYIDACALDGTHSWLLRHRERGDRMTPYGMHGSKLVSDIYAEARMSAAAKRDSWLLTRDGEIVWAVGLRASNLFTVGPDTRRYLRLELIDNNRE
ncbi:MAG: tRNA lysidine(34) synthetase TilS [Bacteroidales bacterium]|nr:tRNA lysidine(34) synthetase TilS [Bacteroidales bacterium]